MQAYSIPFSKVIDIDQGAREHFHVPKYQREYAWGRKEWEQLLQDIEENDPGYFMGSLICVKDGADPVPGDVLIYEVVDGQQRFTTLSLLLMALYTNLTKRLENYTFEDDEEQEDTQAILTGLRAKLIKRKKPRIGEPGGIVVGKHTYFLRVQPSKQNHNLEDYRYVLTEIGLLAGQPKLPYCGNRSIYRAFAYFLEKTTPTEVPALCSMVRKINQLSFVQIIVGSQSDAFTLFESLNNRGIPLSAIDIIKNKLLAEMEHQYQVDIDESFDRWQGIIAALPDTVEQERSYGIFIMLSSICHQFKW